MRLVYDVNKNHLIVDVH